jgi:hypothetical protein
MLRIPLAAAVGTAALLFATCALAAAPDEIELGVRAGYTRPPGRSPAVSRSLGDGLQAMIPLTLEAGYRIGHAYLGAAFQYAFGRLDEDRGEEACRAGDCSVRGLAITANLLYHLLPAERLDPWFGVGFGYETLTVRKDKVPSPYGSWETSDTARGFQFASLQAGGDLRLWSHLAVGPFASLTLGEYFAYRHTARESFGSTDNSGGLKDADLYQSITFGLRIKVAL